MTVRLFATLFQFGETARKSATGRPCVYHSDGKRSRRHKLSCARSCSAAEDLDSCCVHSGLPSVTALTQRRQWQFLTGRLVADHAPTRIELVPTLLPVLYTAQRTCLLGQRRPDPLTFRRLTNQRLPRLVNQKASCQLQLSLGLLDKLLCLATVDRLLELADGFVAHWLSVANGVQSLIDYGFRVLSVCTRGRHGLKHAKCLLVQDCQCLVRVLCYRNSRQASAL